MPARWPKKNWMCTYRSVRRHRAIQDIPARRQTSGRGRPFCRTASLIEVSPPQAPVPLVAALRETSIIFALLIGTFFLKEKFTSLKAAAVLTIFFGVILLKFF